MQRVRGLLADDQCLHACGCAGGCDVAGAPGGCSLWGGGRGWGCFAGCACAVPGA